MVDIHPRLGRLYYADPAEHRSAPPNATDAYLDLHVPKCKGRNRHFRDAKLIFERTSSAYLSLCSLQ